MARLARVQERAREEIGLPSLFAGGDFVLAMGVSKQAKAASAARPAS